MRPDMPARGAFWMLVAGFLLASMGIFVKLGSAHFSGAELVFYRALIGVVSIAAVVRTRGLQLRTAHWKAHVVRSLAGFGGITLLFHTIGVLPLATAVTLNYTSPLFLTLLMVILLKERPNAPLVLATALGFGGIAMLLQPSLHGDQLGAGLLGLVSGFFAGIAFLMMKQLGRLGEPAWRVVFYFMLVSATGAGAWAFVAGFHSISTEGALIIAGMGATATLGQLAMTRAYQESSALLVGNFSYSTVAFTSVLGIAVWGEVLPLEGWLGIGLIVIGGVLAAWFAPRDRQSSI